ncbi:MAG: response regulator transcription factor [Acidimicrobiaceae bacterium]|nr:response regulator transcription factor [Acidimicrobiaceae bacterium]
MAKVLIIDDDTSLQKALRLGLTAHGHSAITAANGEQGISKTASDAPDVVVLDLGLPDIDGLTVLGRIRGMSDVPILVLSATGTDERKVAALDGGADDYVTKPFSMAELEARIRTAIRHRAPETIESGPQEIAVGGLHLDLVHHQTRIHDVNIDLTAREFDLLVFLARNAGRLCTRQMILRAVWGEGYATEAQYLHAYVHRLRHKLGDGTGTSIRTVPGVGYTLDEEPHRHS